jgi:hypothetical protein
MVEEYTKTTIELGKGMSNQEYLEWNINGAYEMLITNPKEAKITLMVYDLHKGILKNRGVDEDTLKEGDNKLLEKIKKDISQKLN